MSTGVPGRLTSITLRSVTSPAKYIVVPSGDNVSLLAPPGELGISRSIDPTTDGDVESLISKTIRPYCVDSTYATLPSVESTNASEYPPRLPT